MCVRWVAALHGPCTHGVSPFDFDPDRNQLKWGQDKAAFARPEYEKWFELWEEERAISPGRSRNFDWMHTQFAAL